MSEFEISPAEKVIAIDGPNSTGKSCLARGLAEWLGVDVLNTGSIYRAIAFRVSQLDITPSQETAIVRLAESLSFKFESGRVSAIDGDLITVSDLDSMDDLVKRISHIPELREIVRAYQRQFAQNGLCIVEGRDIGVVVFPSAIFKVWLECSVAMRAERMSRKYRRYVSTQEVVERDRVDASHGDGRLVKAEDALLLKSTYLLPHQLIAAVEAMMLNRDELVPVVLEARRRNGSAT